MVVSPAKCIRSIAATDPATAAAAATAGAGADAAAGDTTAATTTAAKPLYDGLHALNLLLLQHQLTVVCGWEENMKQGVKYIHIADGKQLLCHTPILMRNISASDAHSSSGPLTQLEDGSIGIQLALHLRNSRVGASYAVLGSQKRFVLKDHLSTKGFCNCL